MVTLGKAELILTHGKFHTVDRSNPVAEAVAIRDGCVVLRCRFCGLVD